jgi:hypothetical protein
MTTTMTTHAAMGPQPRRRDTVVRRAEHLNAFQRDAAAMQASGWHLTHYGPAGGQEIGATWVRDVPADWPEDALLPHPPSRSWHPAITVSIVLVCIVLAVAFSIWRSL